MSNPGIGKILVVDDEVELMNILVQVLAEQGYETVGFTSGEAALEALNETVFDLLLTDLMMQGMDGIALVRESMKVDPNLVCIMMTGQGTIQTAVDAMKVGAFDYVLKPFRLQTMLPVLTRAMNMRHVRLENVQLREAVAIHELSETIAFTLDRQTVLSKLADGALAQSGADEVSILLPDGDELYVAAVRGAKRARLLGERIPLQEGISSWVARERMPLILNGRVVDDRFVALWPRSEIRSAISIPMQVANKLVGVINLNMTNRLRPFTLGQMKALTILAGTAAAALESASLYGQLQMAEENYRSIFENAIEGIFQATPDGRFLRVNPAMARILGYDSPEDVIEKVTDVEHQLYVNPAERTAAGKVQDQEGVVLGFEFEAYRQDRSKICLSLNRRSIYDEQGRELYREGSIEDITERKRAEAELKQSERLLAEAQHLAHVGSWNWDIPNNVMTWSDEYYHILGLNRDEFDPTSGRIAAEYILPEDRDLVRSVEARILASHEPFNLFYRVQRPDGEVRVLHSQGTLLCDDQELPFRMFGTVQDVTERRRWEEEQARLTAEILIQRQRLDNMVASVPGVVWEAWGEPSGATQRIDFVSDYVESMLGYKVEEWLSTPNFWLTIVHPDDREQSAKIAARAFELGESATLEFRWLKKHGGFVWVESNFVTIKDEEGRVVGLRGVNTDIGERKRAEQELGKSEERYRDLIENAQDIIYSQDLEGNYLSSNKAGEDITGYTLDESLRMNLKDIIAPEYLEKAREMMSRKLAGDTLTAYELELIAKDGHRVSVEVNTRLVIENGKPVGIQGIARDITERKRAETELRQLAAAVEETADSIVITDKQGNIQYVNPAFERVTGYAKDEVLNQNPRFLKSGRTSPETYEDLWKTITRGDSWAGHLINRRKDGTMFEERVTISALYDEAHEIINYVAVKQDVSDLILLEEQLRQSQKMEAIGQLAGGVAHDFNNLLTAINGYSSLALQKLDGESVIKGYLEEIRKAGDRAANLTRQLLAFGRKQMLQPLALNLNNVISDMNKMLRRLIGEDIQLTAKLSPALQKTRADPGQIEQVLVNLVVNARDAMPRGGKLTIETMNCDLGQGYASKHVGVQPGKYVILAVSDTGGGMNSETKARIFEPFFTTKEIGKGTGLGLSTVYGIVKQSGGNIWVYSEPGHGTSFKVYLPQIDNLTSPDLEPIVQPVVRGGSETILLVEDEDVVRGLARKILEGNGYRVLDASGGDEAARLCREHPEPIHLLLTDVVMPKTSGKEVARQLTLLRPELRVLYMSGYTDEAIVHHGILDSSVEFIEKPFSPTSLSRKVREVLDMDVVGRSMT